MTSPEQLPAFEDLDLSLTDPRWATASMLAAETGLLLSLWAVLDDGAEQPNDADIGYLEVELTEAEDYLAEAETTLEDLPEGGGCEAAITEYLSGQHSGVDVDQAVIEIASAQSQDGDSSCGTDMTSIREWYFAVDDYNFWSVEAESRAVELQEAKYAAAAAEPEESAGLSAVDTIGLSAVALLGIGVAAIIHRIVKNNNRTAAQSTVRKFLNNRYAPALTQALTTPKAEIPPKPSDDDVLLTINNFPDNQKRRLRLLPADKKRLKELTSPSSEL